MEDDFAEHSSGDVDVDALRKANREADSSLAKLREEIAAKESAEKERETKLAEYEKQMAAMKLQMEEIQAQAEAQGQAQAQAQAQAWKSAGEKSTRSIPAVNSETRLESTSVSADSPAKMSAGEFGTPPDSPPS